MIAGMRFRDEFQRQIGIGGAAAFVVAFWYGFAKVALWVLS